MKAIHQCSTRRQPINLVCHARRGASKRPLNRIGVLPGVNLAAVLSGCRFLRLEGVNCHLSKYSDLCCNLVFLEKR